MGIDHDDAFFLKEEKNIIAHFKKITNGKTNFSLRLEKMYNLKGKVGAIWSNLANTAVENNANISLATSAITVTDDVSLADATALNGFTDGLVTLQKVKI